MRANLSWKSPRKLCSRRALAMPVTYLILFASLMALISVTYSLAVTKISARGAVLKATVAKQNMQLLDNAIQDVSWSFGASKVTFFDESSAIFKTNPSGKSLVLNLTDGQSFQDVVFDDRVGLAVCELEALEPNDDGLFIRGDERTIINQTAFTNTQLYFAAGVDCKEIVLCYRPFVSATMISTDGLKPSNLIRVYVVNLNSSELLTMVGKFCLKALCTSVNVVSRQYDFGQISWLALDANLDGRVDTVKVPIVSNQSGASVKLDVVISNISIRRLEV